MHHSSGRLESDNNFAQQLPSPCTTQHDSFDRINSFERINATHATTASNAATNSSERLVRPPVITNRYTTHLTNNVE